MSKKILIIDDDEEQLHLSYKILTQIGNFQAVVCNDPTEAINTIRKEQPDLILLDIMMPRIDGFTLCKQIRETEDIKNIKIIVLSAKIFDTDKKKAIQLGADAFISKVIDSHKLIDTINQLLNNP
jgi:CheY-like chemotaxis protein